MGAVHRTASVLYFEQGDWAQSPRQCVRSSEHTTNRPYLCARSSFGRLGGRPSTIYLFRRERGDDFFEARIVPQWIPKREQLQIAVAEGTRVAHDLGKLFKREILLVNPRRADRKPLNHQRPVECIFLRWQKLDRAAAFA